MLESIFQSKLIDELEEMFPECFVLKNDPDYLQGFPDLLILYNDKWAVLECKQNKNSRCQMNQKYYIAVLGEISFARFIYPENKEAVLYELQQSFGSRRSTCISKSKQIPLDKL